MKKWAKTGLFLGFVLGIIALWFFSSYFIYYRWPEKEPGAGTIGDMFGAVNALFSGLAFAAIIITIWMQRADIKLQRETFENQKQIMNFQTAFSVVNELTRVKKSYIERVLYVIPANMQYPEPRYVYGIEAIQEHWKEYYLNDKEINKDHAYFQGIIDTFLFTLHYLSGTELDDSHKKILVNIIESNLNPSEILLINYLSTPNQIQIYHELLDYMGFDEKVEKGLGSWEVYKKAVKKSRV